MNIKFYFVKINTNVEENLIENEKSDYKINDKFYGNV